MMGMMVGVMFGAMRKVMVGVTSGARVMMMVGVTMGMMVGVMFVKLPASVSTVQTAALLFL